jgi:hypothetical protein
MSRLLHTYSMEGPCQVCVCCCCYCMLQVQDVAMKELAAQLKDSNSLLFFARGNNYATALEAALKVRITACRRGNMWGTTGASVAQLAPMLTALSTNTDVLAQTCSARRWRSSVARASWQERACPWHCMQHPTQTCLSLYCACHPVAPNH